MWKPLPAEVLALQAQGDEVGAIRRLRELGGLGLQEAQQALAQGGWQLVEAPSTALPEPVLQALRAGRMIDAIKQLRSLEGLGLKEAKDRVDAACAADPRLRQRKLELKLSFRPLPWLVVLAALLALLFYASQPG